MIITGIDIGLARMGVCSIHAYETTKFKKKDIACMTTFKLEGKVEKQDKLPAFILQCLEDDSNLISIIRGSNLVVIEKPFGLKGYANILFELLGIVKFFCIVNTVKFVEIPPMTLKKFATNSGKAQKSDMVLKAFKEFKVEGATEDEIDAFFCALVGDCLIFKNKYTKNRCNSIGKCKIVL